MFGVLKAAVLGLPINDLSTGYQNRNPQNLFLKQL